VRTASFVIPGAKRTAPEQCQDFALDLVLPNTRTDWGPVLENAAILVVADGVSGAPRSALGAQLACRLTIEHALADPPGTAREIRKLLARVHQSWNEQVEALVKASGGRGSDYAATLVMACATPGRALIGAIGDGFAVSLSRVSRVDDLFHLVMPQARPSEEDANVTVTLRNCNSGSDLRAVDLRDPHLKGILISTDGLEEVAIKHRERVNGNVGGFESRLYQTLQTGTVDWLLHKVSTDASERTKLKAAIQANEGIMNAKGDDIGVALAAWD
jgi:hypothetical protein